MRHYRNYTDEDIVCLVPKVISMAQLLKKLGLKPCGGNYNNMRKNLQRLGLSCEHWKGQGWSADHQLKDWSDYIMASSLKPHLIKMRKHQCERCKRKTWLGEKISIEVHHVDGDRTNNDLTNLTLLCPNCHARTNNYRNRK